MICSFSKFVVILPRIKRTLKTEYVFCKLEPCIFGVPYSQNTLYRKFRILCLQAMNSPKKEFSLLEVFNYGSN